MAMATTFATASLGLELSSVAKMVDALLRRLRPVLEAMVSLSYCTAFGVVWDFLSLPQRGYTTGYSADEDDRTPEQLERFGKGLKGINVWYGHEYTVTLVCDFPMPEGAENDAPIEKRGWCIMEKMVLIPPLLVSHPSLR